ncbi:RNA 2',3'-cyclic phosphodiesterase [candidate division KSB1 bacterium]|nr:RNA 2',3'-cyclic phosphodiesterase [candidate division KSB1 bacterium]
MRLFICSELPESILQAVGKQMAEFGRIGADVRWVRHEGMHITLKFLGEVESSRLDDIRNAIHKTVEGISPFRCAVQGLGAFPNLKRPRVYWVGIDDPSEGLKSLATRLDSHLEKAGFQPEDRVFHPHMTLARARSDRGQEKLPAAFSKAPAHFGEFVVDSILLMQSELSPGGACYTQLFRAALCG